MWCGNGAGGEVWKNAWGAEDCWLSGTRSIFHRKFWSSGFSILCLFPFKNPSSLPFLFCLYFQFFYQRFLCLNSSNAVFQPCWVWGCMHVCPALWRLRQKNLELKTSLGSILILCLSKQSFSLWRCVLYKNECKNNFFWKHIFISKKKKKKCPSAL